MPLFLASKALQPFIYQVFDGMDLSPIHITESNKAKQFFKKCGIAIRENNYYNTITLKHESTLRGGGNCRFGRS